ncbi:unnamed protein product, partial [Ectocarpus sp. 6 AP-2014]
MRGAPEDVSSTAAGGTGVGHRGGGDGNKSSSSGGGGDCPGVTTTTTMTLLVDPDLQYGTPVDWRGAVSDPSAGHFGPFRHTIGSSLNTLTERPQRRNLLPWAGTAAAAAAAAATAAAGGARESAGAGQPRARWRARRHLHSRARTGMGGVPAGVSPPRHPPARLCSRGEVVVVATWTAAWASWATPAATNRPPKTRRTEAQLRRVCTADGTALPSCRGSGYDRRSSQTETETVNMTGVGGAAGGSSGREGRG